MTIEPPFENFSVPAGDPPEHSTRIASHKSQLTNEFTILNDYKAAF